MKIYEILQWIIIVGLCACNYIQFHINETFIIWNQNQDYSIKDLTK